MSTNQLNDKITINDVERIAAQTGITLTADDYAAAAEVYEVRRAQIEAQEAAAAPQKRGQWVDRWNAFFPRFLKALLAVGDVSAVLLQTILIGPGLILLLGMLLVVEVQRVYHGISLFESFEGLANFGAMALVLLNLGLELLISYVENRAGWQEPPRYEFSFRLMAQRIGYLFGQNTGWQARAKSPAIRFRSVLRIVTFSILALAIAGSMRSVIEKASGDWLQALRAVIEHSTLIEMFAWLGGLLFALSAVLSAQLLSRYSAQKAIEIAAALAGGGENAMDRALEAAGMAAAAHLLARLKGHQRERRAMASAAGLHEESIVVLGGSEPARYSTATNESGFIGSGGSEPTEPPEPHISPAVNRAIKWLEKHPESADLSNRAAAELCGCSPTTIQRARKTMNE